MDESPHPFNTYILSTSDRKLKKYCCQQKNRECYSGDGRRKGVCTRTIRLFLSVIYFFRYCKFPTTRLFKLYRDAEINPRSGIKSPKSNIWIDSPESCSLLWINFFPEFLHTPKSPLKAFYEIISNSVYFFIMISKKKKSLTWSILYI